MKEEHPSHLLQGSRSLYLLLQSLNSFKFCRDRNISNEHKEEEMKKIIMSAVALTAIIGPVSTLSAADDGINILNDMKVTGEIRPRYEYVVKEGDSAVAANAFTARTHLKMKAGLLNIDGLTTTIGIQSVNNFGSNSYNSTDNGQIGYDVIKDPNFAMLSEASLDYKVGKTALHAGRSQVNLDNQRFIGTVGWRQVERSYDTVYAADNSIENLNLLAAYVYGYQGVGAGVTTNTASVLLNAKYKVMDELTVTGYGYLLSSISDTYGVALTGKINAGAKLTYRAEYAMQQDSTLEYGSRGVVKADATYINLDLGANISGILLGANYEVQSGEDTNGKTAFSTPLGTNHKFNGWADMFLSTPTGGLQDLNVKAGYKTKDFGKLLAVYHVFTADTEMTGASGSTDDLGSEIDAVYVHKIPGVNNLTGLVKTAYYMGGEVTGYTNDKTVGWVQLDYKF
jgi:hypothetical protein